MLKNKFHCGLCFWSIFVCGAVFFSFSLQLLSALPSSRPSCYNIGVCLLFLDSGCICPSSFTALFAAVYYVLY